MGNIFSSFSDNENRPASSVPEHWSSFQQNKTREALSFFYTLQNGYEEYLKRTLRTLSKTLKDQQIEFPKNVEDKKFDDFVQSSYKGRTLEFPKQLTREQAHQMLKTYMDKCLNRKSILIQLGAIFEEPYGLKTDMLELFNRNLKIQSSQVEMEKEERSKKEILRLHRELQEEKAKVLELSLKAQEFEKEKEQLLIRLSHAVGSKLTSNNPAIADLSDEDRPIKLAERFGQTYDNEWTDAFEEITQLDLDSKEEFTIDFLLRIVTTAYQFCSQFRCMFLDLRNCHSIMTCEDINGMKLLLRSELQDTANIDLERAVKRFLHARKQKHITEVQKKFLGTVMGMIQNLAKHEEECRNLGEGEELERKSLNSTFLGSLTDVKVQNVPNSPQNSNEEHKLSLSDAIAAKASSDEEQSLKSAKYSEPRHGSDSKDEFDLTREAEQKQISTQITCKEESPTLTRKFAKTIRCAERVVELCWLMQTAQPAIHLSASIPASGELDKNLFKAFTTTGTTIDFIVWPVMFLYENGPLLRHGVAQPKRKNPKQ